MFKTKNYTYRHIGPDEAEKREMLRTLGLETIDELIAETVPDNIRLDKPLNLPEPVTEAELSEELNRLAGKNTRHRAFIGYGYYPSEMPGVIRRNILENPAWYTAYTPYQAEISQGRLEALINYQTMLTELTGLDLANASLLDDATAAAEAMLMMYNLRDRAQKKAGVNRFFVSENIFPHIKSVIETRAKFKGIEIITGNLAKFEGGDEFFGAIWQYPAADGSIEDQKAIIDRFKEKSIKTAVIADLMALVLLEPPGHLGVDIVTGSTQRFGLPVFYGGPHTGYMVTKSEYKRQMPGRIIGISIDAQGRPAYRMALQTREQHIKREHATSNICTSQVLMAILNGMYAVWHGKEGLQEIARDIHRKTLRLYESLKQGGFEVSDKPFFDTIVVKADKEKIKTLAGKAGLLFNYFSANPDEVMISLDEMTTEADLRKIIEVFSAYAGKEIPLADQTDEIIPGNLLRKDDFLKQEVFRKYRSETALMRYIKKLERKDISLTHSMIPLGSCTMKLNAASELFQLTNPLWTDIHPFVPEENARGYRELFKRLESYLAEITGLPYVSLQPNSGAAGEYTGMTIIKAYFEHKGESNRNVVLIPASAHGTNPASAVMVGMKVVVIKTLANGNIDLADLEAKVKENADNLAAFMVTYPSTHGVFEKDIIKMTELVHRYGGLVYMDGANMNAQVGLTSPAKIGADVCHLNLHKTFAMPHGGGGPGVGPVAVNEKLKDFLPSHALVKTGGKYGRQVASAPWGSALLMMISYAYIRLLGPEGLKQASETAILNANYLETLIDRFFPTLYKGEKGRVAHEFIADLRPFKEYGIKEIDVAKRLMDFGYHAPTVSFPVHGTLMIEPTESENKAEMDRFAEAMEAIYREILASKPDDPDNPLRQAPHTEEMVTADVWFHRYSRKQAAFPLPWVAENKIWPSVARIDDAYGDRHLHCTCDPVEAYVEK